MNPAPIQVETQLTQHDLYKANLSITIHTTNPLYWLMLLISLAFLWAMSFSQYLKHGSGSYNANFILTVGIPIAMVFFAILIPAQASSVAKKIALNNPALRGTTTCIFSETGMHVTGQTFKTEMSWEFIKQARETKH